jgi:hypothetical protein
MSLLDLIVDANFRSQDASRVVVFSGVGRNKGYLVRSPSDELRIKSFLKMFYFAHFAILSLGILLSSVWSTGLNHILGRPEDHLARTMGIFIGIFCFVVGLPYLLLWRSFKKSIFTFVSAQDEVEVSGTSPSQRRWRLVAICIAVFAALIMALGVLLLIRAK